MTRKTNILAYTAGIIDGEGCISMIAHGKSYEIEVQVGNTNEWLIKWLHFNFGGHLIGRKATINRAAVYEWHIAARKAYNFLVEIYPYLMIKKPQAEIAISFGKQQKIAHRATDAEVAVREAQRILIKTYNKRGPR